MVFTDDQRKQLERSFREQKARVAANQQRLDDCPKPHRFVPVDAGDPNGRWYCTVCKGVLSASAVRWYDTGIIDGLEEAKWMALAHFSSGVAL